MIQLGIGNLFADSALPGSEIHNPHLGILSPTGDFISPIVDNMPNKVFFVCQLSNKEIEKKKKKIVCRTHNFLYLGIQICYLSPHYILSIIGHTALPHPVYLVSLIVHQGGGRFQDFSGLLVSTFESPY